MAFDLTRKKAFSSTAIAYIIFLSLIFFTLFVSFSCLKFQNRFIARDQEPPKKLMLETNKNLTPRITCDRSHFRYDLCFINGPTVLDPTDAVFYSIGPSGPRSSFEKVKPYPRKWDNTMAEIREVKLKSGPIGPICEVHHNSPAVVFSAGGRTGNFYHDFNDGFIPLYVTLKNLSMTDRDVILVVDQKPDWWVHKYADLIRGFTKHPIINMKNETSTHCFTRAAVGLISPGKAPPPSPLTVAHFHSFLKDIYSHEVITPPPPNHPKERRPKLVWLSRAGSVGRVIINDDKARAVAEKVGFDVVAYRPNERFTLHDAYALVNGSHAMIGVHGAAMTHVLLARPRSVAVQVVPLGLQLVGEMCFGGAARDVGLEYMEYTLGYNESSLSKKYKKENPILNEQHVVEMLDQIGWVPEMMNVYLKEQDVKLDLVRFKVYMEKVYEKAKRFMDLHG